MRPRGITVPRTPENAAPLSRRHAAPLSRRREKQRVEVEDAQFESVPRMPADTSPLRRRRKRQNTEAEDVELQSSHLRSDAVAWHRVPSGITWSHMDHWNQSWSQSWRSDASAWHRRQSSTSETKHTSPFVKPPEDTAPLSRCWGNQRVEAEDAQFTPVPPMSADSATPAPPQKTKNRSRGYAITIV